MRVGVLAAMPSELRPFSRALGLRRDRLPEIDDVLRRFAIDAVLVLVQESHAGFLGQPARKKRGG